MKHDLVVTAEGQLVNDRTGELLDLAALPLVDVARLRGHAREALAVARHINAACENELEMRHRTGGLAGAPFPVKRSASWKWDAGLVHQALAQLVEEGKLDAKEAAALLPEVTVRKPAGVALKSLLSRLMASDLDDAALLQRAVSEQIRWTVDLPEEADAA